LDIAASTMAVTCIYARMGWQTTTQNTLLVD
jgi:hypothetical protein